MLKNNMNNIYFSQQRQDVLRMIDVVPINALDVGCGEGHFGKILKNKFGTQVDGIEPDPQASDVAATNLNKCYRGVWSDLADNITDQYDAIFFNDSLEHMIDPETALKAASKKLTENGLIYASIPNFLYVDNIFNLLRTRDWMYQDSGILDRTHLRFFTRKSIDRLFLNSGYKIHKIEPLKINDTWKWRLLNRIFCGNISDFIIYQYGIVACLDKK